MYDKDKKIMERRVESNLSIEAMKRRLNIKKLKFFCASGYVRVVGTIEFDDGRARNDAEISVVLCDLDREYSRMYGVKYVKYFLEGWEKVDNNKWVNTGGDPQAQEEVKKNKKPEGKTLDEFVSETSREGKIGYIQAHVKARAEKRAGFLIKWLPKEEDKFVTATLVKAIGFLAGKDALDAIIGYLDDDDERVVANTIEGIEFSGNTDSIKNLMPFISHSNNRIRANAIKALASFGKYNVLKGISEMISSSSVAVKLSAVYALGSLPQSEATPFLIKVLKDEDPDVRKASIYLIGKFQIFNLLADIILSETSSEVLSEIFVMMKKNNVDFSYVEKSQKKIHAALRSDFACRAAIDYLQSSGVSLNVRKDFFKSVFEVFLETADNKLLNTLMLWDPEKFSDEVLGILKIRDSKAAESCVEILSGMYDERLIDGYRKILTEECDLVCKERAARILFYHRNENARNVFNSIFQNAKEITEIGNRLVKSQSRPEPALIPDDSLDI